MGWQDAPVEQSGWQSAPLDRGASPSALAELATFEDPNKMGKIKAYARGLEEFSSFSLTDELRGFGRAVGTKLRGDERAFSELLDRGIDEVKAEYDKARTEQPGATMAGEITGAILPAFTPGGQVLLSRLGAGGLKQVALKSGATGAASGGLHSFGSAEGDAMDRLPDTLRGSAVGAGIGVAVPFAGAGLNRLNTKTIIPNADKIRKRAKELYQKAEKIGANFAPEFTENLINRVSAVLPQSFEGATVAGRSIVNDVVDRFTTLSGKHLSLKGIHEIDKFLGGKVQALMKAGEDEQAYGLRSIQGIIRNMVDDPSYDGFITGGREGIEALKEGRKLFSSAYKLDDMEDIIKFSDTYKQPVTAIQTGFRRLSKDAERMGYTSDEIELLDRASRTNNFTDALAILGSRLTAIGGAVSGGPIGAAAGYLSSTAARSGATASQLSRANAAIRKVAERSGMVRQEKRIKLPKYVQNMLLMPQSKAKEFFDKLPVEEQQQALKLLPAPKREIIVGPSGVARNQTDDEIISSSLNRSIDRSLGLTPDIRRAISKSELSKKFGPVWDKIQDQEKDKIQKEIAAAWKNNGTPIEDIIEESIKRTEKLQEEIGEKTTTSMSDAFSKIKKTKK